MTISSLIYGFENFYNFHKLKFYYTRKVKTFTISRFDICCLEIYIIWISKIKEFKKF